MMSAVEPPARLTEDPDWLLVEEGFTLTREHELESIFAIGNGHLGSRGSLAEGSAMSSAATFVAGLFDGHPGSTTTLAVLPDWSHLSVSVEGGALRLDEGRVFAGAQLARRAGAELIVLQVVAADAPILSGRDSLAPPLYVDQPQHEWSAWAAEFIERLGCVCPLAGLRVRLMLGRGTPAAEILRVARAHVADLIVLAWKGGWGPERAGLSYAKRPVPPWWSACELH